MLENQRPQLHPRARPQPHQPYTNANPLAIYTYPRSQSFSRSYGSSLPTSLTCIVLSQCSQDPPRRGGYFLQGLFFFFFRLFWWRISSFFFFLQLTRWRGPGQTWRVRGNIFVAQIRSETPPDVFLILPLLCSATDTPIFCTSGNNHIPSHTDTVRVCWKQSFFSKSGSVQCNKRSRSDQAKRIYFFGGLGWRIILLGVL